MVSHFDLIIRGGTVIDGSSKARRTLADVAVAGGRIQAVGDLGGATALQELNAKDFIVCPGFIDVHTHIERALLGGPHQYAAARQGVTTVLTGPDGFGWTGLPSELARSLWRSTSFAYGNVEPVEWSETAREYLAQFHLRSPVNVVPQAPHQEIRARVMGWDPSPATPEQRRSMIRALEEWLDAGAVSLCTGLDYQPAANSDWEELRTLCDAAAQNGALYAAHLRYAELGVESAWREIMNLHRATGVSVHVSHEVATSVTGRLLEECDDGIDLTFESYLYPAGCTHLAMMLPLAAQVGGSDAIEARLRDETSRQGLREALRQAMRDVRKKSERIVVVATPTGLDEPIDILSAARERGVQPEDLALKLLEQHSPYALAIYHRGWTETEREDIFQTTIQHPRVLIASDGVYHGPFGHPRSYGCFPQVIRRFVRERGSISLEAAIHRMSGFPASRFGLSDRGILQNGAAADIVIFDESRVRDTATWDQPFSSPVGIRTVLVNGTKVIDREAPTGALPGQVVTRA